jgi:hypothetical protein|tara:strand:- start:3469 stop:3702 length:234 start_codon:yes stop_codon:yes gene_type:complete
MKEQTLLEMKNKVEALARVVQHLLHETNNLRELSVGTLETLKLMDGYEAAIETLKEKLTENIEGKKETQNEKEELPT